MKKVKFNVVNLSDQKITRNEMKNVAGGYASQIWCLCIVTRTGTGFEQATCVASEDECYSYGAVRYFSCDSDGVPEGVVGC